MQTIFLFILFIIQMIGFYLIVLLYTKVSKFNDLEKKQQKLMAEMDDSIAAYLAELKEENERLITIIEKRQQSIHSNSKHSTTTIDKEVNHKGKENGHFPKPKIPLNVAMQSYQSYSKSTFENEVSMPMEVEMDERTKTITMHEKGKSIEEIAKALGKGKTEVELLLKFR